MTRHTGQRPRRAITESPDDPKSQNRLVSCVNANTGTTSSFTYGADGRRRRMTVNGTATDFALDGQSVVRELRNGAPFATYLHGTRGPEYNTNPHPSVSRTMRRPGRTKAP